MTEKAGEIIITSNKKAEHEFFILQKLEAGISLTGTEVKALRQKKANIGDAYATIREGEVWLINANISIYNQGNINNHDPLRKRKLLLKKNEIRKLRIKTEEKGFTLIPLKLYFKNGKVKVEIAVARGKKSFDKREAITKKDLQRETERKIKY